MLGARLAHNLKGGEVIELVSDLGGGKTTLVRGLARGLGSHDHVSSPTFKISNVYAGKDLTLYHFDFYRLSEAGLLAHELHDVLTDPKAIVVIEWGQVVSHVLPPEHLTVTMIASGDDERQLSFHYPKDFAYLLKGIRK